jgi:DNA-binding LacI/PurR family transcriptional regulator
MQKRTIKQVAERVGYSVMTVSRALRGLDGVNERTRRKILDAAGHLGYVPSVEARALRSGGSASVNSTPCIALVFGWDTQFADLFFCSVTRGVEQKAAQLGYCPIQVHIEQSFERSWPRLKSAFSVANLCGCLLVGQFGERDMQFILGQTENTVVVDGPVPDGIKAGSAAVDYTGGARLALEHLEDSGCRRILVITGPGEHYFSKSIKTASDALKGRFERLEIVESDFTGLSGIDVIRDKFRKRLAFDGIFSNDDVALGVLRGLAEAGIKCPEDVKVVGFDDIPFCQLSVIQLTSVSVDKRSLGAAAVEMLNEMIEGKTDSINISRVAKTKLNIRESSK